MGLFPRIIMIGTLTALQWFIYDSVKVKIIPLILPLFDFSVHFQVDIDYYRTFRI